MKTVKRNYKDSLFRDIFKDEKRLAEIYAGMFDEPVAAIDIELAALDWTFFTGIRNDVSCATAVYRVIGASKYAECQHASADVGLYCAVVPSIH